jgi:hypothetical protein
MRTRLLAALVVLAVVAPAGLVAASAPRQAALRPTVVVAIADLGVNPYHEVFRRPANTRHPCAWVAGFTDCSVPALRLSIGTHRDYASSVAADREVWESVEPGRWYWIPGTNIIGAVCDGERGGEVLAPDPTCILDDHDHGHGTATASSVLSEAPDALLLVHDGKSSAAHLATAPVVPDVQSHSWGPPAPVPLHAVDVVVGPERFCNSGTRRPETVFFLAAGNEAPFPTWVDCDRQRRDVHVVGGAWPGRWDYRSWSSYDFASWMCRPVARHDSTTEHRERICGTSFSAPTVAGTAAAALLELRRSEGYVGRSTQSRVTRAVTREQFDRALREAATYTPDSKFANPAPTECSHHSCLVGPFPLPAQAPWLFWGYGWLDSTLVDAVVACASRRGCPPKPVQAREYNDRRRELRGLSEEDVLAPGPQSDAGSGRDAGDARSTGVVIAPDRGYAGRLEPRGVRGDVADWYLFRARAGQRISVAAVVTPDAPVPGAGESAACWTVLDPKGRRISRDADGEHIYADGCDTARANALPQDVAAPETGVYVLAATSNNGAVAHDYRVTLTLR